MQHIKPKITLFSVFKYITFFMLFYLLHCANIEGIYAFAFGMLFALVWCNQKIWLLAPLYILSAYLAFFTLDSVIISGATAIVFILAYLAHYKLKRPLNPVLIGLYAVLSQGVFLWFNLTSPESLITCLIAIVVGVVCMVAYLHIMQSLVLYGLKRKFTIDQLVAGGIVICALGLGVACVPVAGLYLIKFSAAFFVLFACFMFRPSAGVFIGIVIGIGAALATMDAGLIAIFALYGLMAGAFKATNRAFAAAAVILIDVFMGLLFAPALTFDYGLVIAVSVGAVLFVIIPARTLGRLAGAIVLGGEDSAVRNIVNRSREALCRRMLEISEVFLEMQHVFRGLVKGVLPVEEAKDYLAGDVLDKLCQNCPDCTRCLKTSDSETKKVIAGLIGVAFARGKVTILDIPQYLASRCNRINIIIGTINSMVGEYRQYVNMINNVDTSRLLVGEQLYGVSQLMLSLADEVKRNVTFDTTKENKIIEDLLYENVVCSEAVVYEQNLEVANVTLVVKNKDVKNPVLEQVVSNVIGGNMVAVSANLSEKATFSIVNLRTAPKFDMVFGSAGAKKHGSSISGDTHSILRIGDDKYLLALCDGMGSGEAAERTSSLAISLIENFYKAGFESSLILSSVNKLLGLGGEEKFSAIDVCVVDLRSSVCDLIKVGSPIGFIKHTDDVELIEAGALPLGILDSVSPNVTTRLLSAADMIILLTDGIIDSFESAQELSDFINNVRTTNPQVLADEILNQALILNKSAPNDDLTVLIGRVFTK